MGYNFKIKKLPRSEVEIECTLPAEELERARPKALKKFAETINVDGFRKGNVPERIVLEKVGEKAVLEEAAEILLNAHYPSLLVEAKQNTIGRPAISIVKLALGNPFEFKVRSAVVPEFVLPEYRKISEEIVEKPASAHATAGAEEVEEVLLQIRKNKAHIDKTEELPELNDEFARAAGNFQNIEELKEKVRENIIQEKKNREIEKRRAEIMEALLKNTEIELPDILVMSEVEKSLAQFKDDIARMGGRWQEYLTSTKKTEEDVKKDMYENSIKKAKIQLIFNKIAEAEKLEPNKEILEEEVKQIMEHYKDASETNARIYVATQLTNQAVLKLLEQ